VTDHSRDLDFQKEIVAKTGIPVTLRAERSYCCFDRRSGGRQHLPPERCWRRASG
jgi:hypothetical protein